MSNNDLLPQDTAKPAPAAPAPSAALQAAPQAVRRSMPMALSIALGLLSACVIGWFFYNLTWFLLLIYLSFIIATILEAPVHWLGRRGIRRTFATVLVMFSGVAVVAAAAYALINQLVLQFAQLTANLEKLPNAIHTLQEQLSQRFPMLTSRLDTMDVSKALPTTIPWQTFFQHAISSFEILTYVLVCFFIVMYMLIEGPSLLKALRRLMPKESRLEATRVFEAMATAHRHWFVASSCNIFSASILTMTGLWLVGVPAAMVLGIIAGLGELVPNIGPFFGALPSLLVVLAVAPHEFWSVVLMFLIVQTIQGYTISPFVMKIGVRLPVLALIVAAIIGGVLFGALGVAIAIPLTADLIVLWNYLNSWLDRDTSEATDLVNAEPESKRQAPKDNGSLNLRAPPPAGVTVEHPAEAAGRTVNIAKI